VQQPLALQLQALIWLLLQLLALLLLVLLQSPACLWLRQLHQLLALPLLPLSHPLLHLPSLCRLLELRLLPALHSLPWWHLHQGVQHAVVQADVSIVYRRHDVVDKDKRVTSQQVMARSCIYLKQGVSFCSASTALHLVTPHLRERR
jgi:hypothetical protein